MNSPMTQILSQNQTLHGYVAYNWSYGHFCDFWLILAKIWLPWQRPLHPCKQKCLLWIGWPQNPLLWVIAFSLSLVEMHLYAAIAILVPKLVAMVTPLCRLCTEVSHMNSLIAQTLYQTKLCIDVLHTTEVMAISLIFFCLFRPKFGCHGNVP